MSNNYKDFSAEEKAQLWTDCQNGCKEARDKIIEANLPLVGAIAKKYTYRPEEYGELFQGGVVGLIQAVDRFDPSRGVNFPSYAFSFIHGEVLRQREKLQGRKRDRNNELLAAKIKNFQAEFVAVQGREPEIREIAAALQEDTDAILWSLESNKSSQPTLESEEISFCDTSYDDVENKVFLTELLQELTAKERNILLAHYWDGKTQMQIAAELGLSQTQISRLEKNALLRLKRLAGT